MYSEWVGPAVAGFLALWLLVLNIIILRQSRFLKSLFPKTKDGDIRKKFEEILEVVGNSKTDLKELERKLVRFSDQGLKHVQRIELLRFNPFEDTGGNISFSLVLLDGVGTGIVITSLHARSGTRLFAKPIIEGKAQNVELSKEEETAINKALEQKI